MTIPLHLHPFIREAARTIGTVADRVTTQGIVTPLVDIRGLILARIRGQDRAQGPRHRSPANLASRLGTLEDKASERPWIPNSSVMVTST